MRVVRAASVVLLGVIIGPDSGVAWVGGTGMPPEAPTPSPHLPLTVIYSDGTSEVIE